MNRIEGGGRFLRHCVTRTPLLLLAVLTMMAAGSAQDPGWPRQIVKTGGKLICCQPQVDDWNNYQTLNARMAFTVTPTGGKNQVGVMTVQMQTIVNVDTHTVLLSNPQITSVTFPSLDPATSAEMGSLLRYTGASAATRQAPMPTDRGDSRSSK